MNFFKSVFFIKDGKKNVLNTKNIKYLSSALVIIIVSAKALWPEDNSHLSKSHTQLSETSDTAAKLQDEKSSDRASEVLNAQINEHKKQFHRNQGAKSIITKNIKLKADQVILRDQSGDNTTSLPSGSNFIGKLLNSIDTRDLNQIVKAIIPYSVQHKSGGNLPKNTILLGKVSNSDRGNKIYVNFYLVVFPSGAEFPIKAQAINTKDYSLGLYGEDHSNSDLKLAASVGLKLVSAASEVLTKRSGLSGIDKFGNQVLVPDSTVKNAVLQGVSQVAKDEASDQVSKIEKDYLTLEAGSDLIINLLAPFNPKGH